MEPGFYNKKSLLPRYFLCLKTGFTKQLEKFKTVQFNTTPGDFL